MFRKPVSFKKHRKQLKYHGTRTKAINVKYYNHRGGVRL